jgi:FAD binding domain of DNA photolyase
VVRRPIYSLGLQLFDHQQDATDLEPPPGQDRFIQKNGFANQIPAAVDAQVDTGAVINIRVFNPLLQSEKFDPEGHCLLRYEPQPGGLPKRLRHRPWQANVEQLRQAGVRFGVDYPHPGVDLKVTGEAALERFKALAR